MKTYAETYRYPWFPEYCRAQDEVFKLICARKILAGITYEPEYNRYYYEQVKPLEIRAMRAVDAVNRLLPNDDPEPYAWFIALAQHAAENLAA